LPKRKNGEKRERAKRKDINTYGVFDDKYIHSLCSLLLLMSVKSKRVKSIRQQNNGISQSVIFE
jgi:hypothetical protein